MINRNVPPSEAKKIDFEIPEIKVLKTKNNLEIYFVKKDKLPIVYSFVSCFAGSKNDPLEKKGLAYLTSLLIDEGAGEFDSLQLSDEFEKLGSLFSTSVQHDSNDFSLLSLKENFERSFFLLSQVLTKPHFNKNDFDREKKKLLDRILQLKDDASYIASSVFERIVFKNSFYELPEFGFANTVQNISNEDVVDFYQKYFAADKLKLFVVGNIDENELIEIVENNLSYLKVESHPDINFNQPTYTDKAFYLIDKKDSPQSEIRIGHLAKKRNSADYYATRIMNTILGGQFSSRINLNLREKKGYTYGASSSFGYYKEAGLFEVNTAVNIENTANAIIEIFNELDGIRKYISDKEIDFAKSYLIKQFPLKFETYSQIEKNVESLVVHSLPLDELKTYQHKIESVSNEEVIAAALNNILLDKLVIVIVGDKNKVSQQLRSVFGLEAIELDNEGNKISSE